MQSKGEMQGSDLGRGTKAEKKVFFFFFPDVWEWILYTERKELIEKKVLKIQEKDEINAKVKSHRR